MPTKTKDKRGKLKSQKRTKATEELPKATKFKTDRQKYRREGNKTRESTKRFLKDTFNRESSRGMKKKKKIPDPFNIKEKTPQEKRQKKMAERIFEENRIDTNQNIESKEMESFSTGNPLSYEEDKFEEYIGSSSQAYMPQVQQEDSLPVFLCQN